jgi:hypothetical protein
VKSKMLIDIENNLSRFASWQSVVAYFGRSENGQNSPVNRIIEPIITKIARANLFVKVFHTEGEGNFYSFFVCNNFPQAGTVLGYMVYLSVLAPIGVIGKSKVTFYDQGMIGTDDLNLSNVLNSDEIADELGRKVLQIVTATEYELLTRQDVSKTLSNGLKRQGYCFIEPCDKFFHVLFDWTD